MEIYPEVTTRKLVLVGHSQGAFYTNDMYSYLLAHGEPKDALNVYNVGSPATFTAGNGTYLNSSGDTLLAYVREFKSNMLPNNADLGVSDTTALFPGHNFVADYLGYGGSRIASDINGEMSLLSADDASAQSDCFTPPIQTLGYKTTAVAFAIADPTAVVLKTGTVATIHASEVALSAASKVAVGAVQMFADTITVTTSPPTVQKQTQVGEKIINKLYGSSLDGLSPQDKKDLLGSNQGAAVALVEPPKAQTVSGIVLGTSTEATTTLPQASTTIAIATSTPQFPPVDPNFFNWLPGGGGGPITSMGSDPVEQPTSTSDVADTTPPTTDVQIPPPAPIVPAATVLDSFDSYDGSGWSTIQNNPNGTYTIFVFSDGSNGNCRSGGCLDAGNSGSGGIGGGGHVDYMYKDTGAGGLSGAYSIWGLAQKGFANAQGFIGVCTNAASGCTAENSSAVDNILADALWHHYYIAWRQGTNFVESCFMIDDTNPANCAWKASLIPSGTELDAFILNGFTSRHDLGDNVFFDDLEREPTPQ